MSRSDIDWMALALAQARRGLGRTWPNPTVGCVLVRDDRLLAAGFTQPGGRPHAEAAALADATARGLSDAVRGATAYVTLEPCAHHGRTPPCADALVAAGITRVVYAAPDPDPRVDGRGGAILRAAGIDTEEGLGRAEAEEINAGFLSRIRRGRPLVTLKLATSLDGRIALASGESRWITGPTARAQGHLLRATHDAILVGIGTVLADDPDLTCRLPGLAARSPVRVVLDSRARLPLASRLVRTARDVPVWLIATPEAPQARRDELQGEGVRILDAAALPDGRPDLGSALRLLGGEGLTRVLTEGGATLSASLVGADLVDRLVIFRGGIVLGGDSRAAIDPLGLPALAAAPRFERMDVTIAGDDGVEVWRRHG